MGVIKMTKETKNLVMTAISYLPTHKLASALQAMSGGYSVVQTKAQVQHKKDIDFEVLRMLRNEKMLREQM